jgi:hypothetical protein
MTSADRYRRMDATRLRAELTVHDLWLRYVAIGGTEDGFDIDGYLQGLLPLDAFQQELLAHVLNEALDDLYRMHHIPSVHEDDVDERLIRIIADLLGDPPQPPAPPGDDEV